MGNNLNSYNGFIRLFPKKTDLQNLMKFYDIDGDGNICYEEFLRGLRYLLHYNINDREELTDRKKKMVEKAFNILDKDGSGLINIKDIIQVYDVSKNKEFIEGKKSRDQILMEFLNNFDGAKGNNDG